MTPQSVTVTDDASKTLQPAAATAARPVKVLVPFNCSAYVYGLERAVIDLFDVLQPRIEPHFLMSQWHRRENLPVLQEVRRRGLAHSFFSDTSPWPILARPRSAGHAWKLLVSTLKGNRDVLRQALRCDALYLAGIHYGVYSILACLYYRLTGKPVIYQFHELKPRHSRALWLLRFAIGDFVHMTETGFRITSGGNPYLLARPNHVIPNVVNVGEPGEGDDAPERLSRGKRTILFIGRVSLDKGIDYLLRAMALLGDKYADVVLLVMGGCAPEFQAEFDALLREPGLKDRVVYLGYRQDVPRFMEHAYAQVLPTPPSRTLESAPCTIVEAMAYGVPMVCFRSGGSVDMVVDGETGLICAEESAACLADSLRRLLDDRAFRDRCSAGAQSRFQTVYSAETVAAGWEKLLERKEKP